MASILRTKASTWRAQIESRGSREYRTFPTRKAAVSWARERELHLENQTEVRPFRAPSVLLAAVIERYRFSELPNKRNRSYPYTLKILSQRLGHVDLHSLSSSEIADHRNERLQTCSPATVVKELNLLRSLLDFAKSDMSIALAENVARQVKNPKVRNERSRLFLPGEEKFLLDNCRNSDLQDAIGLAVETAMRLGELLQLEFGDIDWASRVALVRHQPQAGRHTKTDEGREVPLSSTAIQILEKRRNTTSPRVFGVWTSGDSFEKCWRRGLARCQHRYAVELAKGRSPTRGFLADLRFHDMRHVATSRLAKTFHVLALARITGHRNLKSLARYYHASGAELAKLLH